MSKKNILHIDLPDREKRLAKMRSAQLGRSLSGYFTELVRDDAATSGIDKLFTTKPASRKQGKEVGHA